MECECLGQSTSLPKTTRIRSRVARSSCRGMPLGSGLDVYPFTLDCRFGRPDILPASLVHSCSPAIALSPYGTAIRLHRAHTANIHARTHFCEVFPGTGGSHTFNTILITDQGFLAGFEGGSPSSGCAKCTVLHMSSGHFGHALLTGLYFRTL